MSVIVPFIMKNRVGSSNLLCDKVNVTKLEEYIKDKQQNCGMKNLSMMHVLIAAYCRTVASRPALNRFIRGQRVYTRRSIEICLAIKKEMTTDSPDTVVKVFLGPEATLGDVYEQLDKIITDYRNNPGGDFDNTAKAFSHTPAVIFRGLMGFFKFLDYFGLLPKYLTKVSPFHCSMFITSMGSLGIPAIYHHLYDFGTCPMFIAFGAKKRRYEVNPDGSVYKSQSMDIKFTTDERICDGFYYSKVLKTFKSILMNPYQLDEAPEEILEDID